MPNAKPRYIVTAVSADQFSAVEAFFRRENAKAVMAKSPNDSLKKIYDATSELGGRHVLKEVANGRNCEIRIYDGRTTSTIEGNSLKEALSNYILRFRRYDVQELSVRSSAKDLEEFRKDGSPALSKSPNQWIADNDFFRQLPPLYDRLLSFVLNERGMFPKIWELNSQKNYWNGPLNGGLPILKKKDATHEGTFMLHDICHFMFRDPVVTGTETPEEMKVYVAYRMMSEACTLVLADMFAVAHADLEKTDYDVGARKIYPMFKSLRLKPQSLEAVRTVLLADCLYCLTGDKSYYVKLGASKDSLAGFTDKYGVFFSVDFQWNESNIENMVSEIQGNPALQGYFEVLPSEVGLHNTHSLYEAVKTPRGGISFTKLFNVFWKQFVSMLEYDEPVSLIKYRKQAALDYLSGQIRIAFTYQNDQLIDSFRETVTEISAATEADEVLRLYESLRSRINRYITKLGESGDLLPHEVVIYQLHVPHFPPIFFSYDKPKESYEPLSKVSENILGDSLDVSAVEKESVSKDLSDLYASLTG